VFQWIINKLPIPALPNPIPEIVKPIIGSHYFWVVLWLATANIIGSKLLGKNFGGWAGVVTGGAMWCILISKSSTDLLLVVAIALLPFLGKRLNRSVQMHRFRGVKICPDCAEEIKELAKVCKHCAHCF
jgi:hypothetical protein